MPTDATLTRTEKNLVLKHIQECRFDPADFRWIDIESKEHGGTGSIRQFSASRLIHSPTQYYFTFGGYDVEYSPGSRRKVESDRHYDNWQAKEHQLQQWLHRLKKEVEAPDLWAAVGNERALSGAVSSPLENRPFTDAEQSQIRAALDELKRYLVTTQSLQDEQLKSVEQQLRYLEESSRRLGRKDWVNILFSTLISLALTLALPPERANGLLQLAGNLLHRLWDGMQELIH